MVLMPSNYVRGNWFPVPHVSAHTSREMACKCMDNCMLLQLYQTLSPAWFTTETDWSYLESDRETGEREGGENEREGEIEVDREREVWERYTEG